MEDIQEKYWSDYTKFIKLTEASDDENWWAEFREDKINWAKVHE